MIHGLHMNILAKEHLLIHFTVSQRFQDTVIQEKQTGKVSGVVYSISAFTRSYKQAFLAAIPRPTFSIKLGHFDLQTVLCSFAVTQGHILTLVQFVQVNTGD